MNYAARISAQNILCCFLCFILLFTGDVQALNKSELQGIVQKYKAKHRRLKLSVAISDASRGSIVFTEGANSPVSPASVMKVVTSGAALRLLGAQYRFPTELFVDRMPAETAGRQDKGNVGNLYVRGYGDPSLVIEDVWLWARRLKRFGVKSVDDLVIDSSLFIDPRAASGTNAYEAGSSAVSVNHNCYELLIAPTKPGKPANVTMSALDGASLVAEVMTVKGTGINAKHDQRPPSPDYVPQASFVPGVFSDFTSKPTKVSLKGTIGELAGNKSFYRTVPDPPRYFAGLFRDALRLEGINLAGRIKLGETPGKVKLIETFESVSLSRILQDLNYYSNNFIAEQLLFSLGQDSVGYFRRDKGIERLGAYLKELGVSEQEFKIFDGSGLDRKNRLSAQAVVRVLNSMYRDLLVGPDFIASLSRFGASGTLKSRWLEKKRRKKKPHGEPVWGKTGTLNGVSAIAGYAPSRKGVYSYAIIINGVGKGVAVKLENEILRILTGVPK